MTKRYLNDESIQDLLSEPIPSDYNYDTETDTEDEEECEYIDSIQILEDQSKDEELVIELNDSCTVIAPGESDSNFQENTNGDRYVPENKEKRKWKKKEEKMIGVDFERSSVRDAPCLGTPCEAFQLFFDEAILDRILFETNLRSVQKNKPALVTKGELLSFLGINIVMGYNPMHAIVDYWRDGDDLGVPCIKKTMARERFLTILRNLHLNDNSKIDPSAKDKLYKVRPLVEALNANFQKVKQPEEHLSVDESMIKFKGRSSLKQYNPMKPIKRGFKLWCLADDKGYVYKFDVYCGKSQGKENSSTLGLGGNVVMDLVNHLPSRYHKVYFDNFFSSIPLMESLRLKKILACATIRPTRKDFPTLQEDKSLKRGEFDYRSTSDGITVFRWKDSKAVNFISNYHGIDLTSVERKEKDGRKTKVPCPQVVKDYNAHMGGVDTHDMLRQIYGIHRKNIKWWHRIFFGLLDMAIVNSFLVFREAADSKISQKEYRRHLAKGLLTYSHQATCPKRRKSAFSIPASVRNSNVGVHMPEFNAPKRRCEVCSKDGLESRPTSPCSHCGVNLCCNGSKNCFVRFHSQ